MRRIQSAEEEKEFFEEGIINEIQNWLNIYESLELSCVSNQDIRLYLWLGTLMQKIEDKDKKISELQLLWEVKKKKNEVSKDPSSPLEPQS